MREEEIERGKVGASLDNEVHRQIPVTSANSIVFEQDDDNIPLRIMLLLMDEVFDLQSRNQWLRRRIVAILRPMVKAFMGDSINK